jgi:hypothetical protein
MGSSWPRTLAMPFTQVFAPGTRVRPRGHREHLAGFLACGEIQLAGHAEGHAHPLARARVLRGGRGGDRASTALELGEQLERSVTQGFEWRSFVHENGFAQAASVACALATSWSGETGLTM